MEKYYPTPFGVLFKALFYRGGEKVRPGIHGATFLPHSKCSFAESRTVQIVDGPGGPRAAGRNAGPGTDDRPGYDGVFRARQQFGIDGFFIKLSSTALLRPACGENDDECLWNKKPETG